MEFPGRPSKSDADNPSWPVLPEKSPIGRTLVTRGDLEHLRTGEFLNDVVIDFYMKCVPLCFGFFYYKTLEKLYKKYDGKHVLILSRYLMKKKFKTYFF